MRFGGEMHDGIMSGHDAFQQRGVADVAHDQFDPGFRQSGDVLGIARIGELVQHRDVHVRMVPRHIPHEIRADEPTSASHQNISRLENAAVRRHIAHPFSIASGTRHTPSACPA